MFVGVYTEKDIDLNAPQVSVNKNIAPYSPHHTWQKKQTMFQFYVLINKTNPF